MPAQGAGRDESSDRGRYKIAMVAACPFPSPRGTPIRVHRLAEALAQRGHDVHVVAYHLGRPLPQSDFKVHRIPKVPTYRKESPGPTYQKLLVLDSLLSIKLRRVLRSRRFDLVHAHHFEGLIAALLAGAGGRTLPVVFDAHTLLETELPFYRLGLPGFVKRWVGRQLDRRLPKLASAIIAVTEEIRDALVYDHAVERDKIAVVQNGVEVGLFARSGPEGGDELSPERTLIYTGNLGAYQGVELMLEAFGAVRAVRGDVRLRVITHSSFGPYESLASRLGVRDNIEVVASDFAGLVEQLAAADVALHPRLRCDGYPQKLLNYMAAGKAIVSFAGSARGLAPEESALIVADGDVAGFAQAILRLLDDRGLARRLGEAARRFVASERNWSQAAIQVENVYAGLSSRASPGTRQVVEPDE